MKRRITARLVQFTLCLGLEGFALPSLWAQEAEEVIAPTGATFLKSVVEIDTAKLKNDPHDMAENNKSRHAFAKLIKADNPMIRYLEWLFIEQGQALPSQVYPISYEEIRYLMTQYLDQKRLSSLGQKLYTQIWAKTEVISLWGAQDWVAIDPVLGVTAEFYLGLPRANRDWYLYSFKDRPAFVNLGAEVSLFDRLYIETTAHISQDPTWIDLHPNNMRGNIILNISAVYAMMPQDAYASISVPHFNIQGGRNKLSWGNGNSGNLLLSNAPGELDYLQVSTWWDPIKFTALWVSLDYVNPMRNAAGDIAYYDAGNRLYPFAQDPLDLAAAGVQPSQFFLAHRLDFTLGSRMNLSFTEAMIYKDYWQNVGFLNPFFMFHNTYLTGHADYFLSVDAQIALMPRWTLYTQILFDQVSAGANRLSLGTLAYPGSIPFLIGTEVITPMSLGYISWIFEFVKIDPYSYLDRSSVGLFFDKRWLSSYAGAHKGQNGYELINRVPLGYYRGNDLLRFWVQLRYEQPDFLGIWTEQSVLVKGKMSIDKPWSDAPGEALKKAGGDLDYIQVVSSFGGKISFSRWLGGQNLSFKADLTFINTIFESNTDLDLQFGVGLGYLF